MQNIMRKVLNFVFNELFTFSRLALVYVMIGIVTFGYVATHTVCEDYRHRSEECSIDNRGSRGTVAAVGWPLYWSWTVWEMHK